MFLTCFKQFVINRFYDVIDFCHNNSLSAIPTPDDSGLKKESVELQWIPSPDAPVIQTVRAWMKRVLTLLLDNAGKFTEKGVIRLQCEEDKENNIIRFVIEDTGIGIDPQYQETVFERFFKVDSFTPGTGLGLSIARQVMDIVDGKIYLDTSYNGGVRVVVEWPMN